MSLFDSLSKPFVRLIEARAAANARQVVEQIREEADKWRPRGHRSLSGKRRDYYEGRQVQYLRDVLNARHPIRGEEMTPVVLNYLRLIAEQDSDVFRGRPTYATDQVSAEEEFNELIRSVRLNRVLKEAERRLMIARSIFFRVMDNPVRGRTVVDTFWPADIDIVPHPGDPTSVESALAVMLRVSGGDGVRKKCYEVWTRPSEDEPYEVTRIDEDGNETLILESGDGRTWPLGRHPIVAWHAGDPSGMPFLDDDHDLVDMQDAINVGWTHFDEMVRFQAASALVYEGTDDGQLAVGPGLATRVNPGESLSVLDFNAKLRDVLEGIDKKTRALAVTRRQSPNAYASEPQAQVTGIALKIQNQPQEEAREERVDHAVEMVEDHLLPRLAEVSDMFRGTRIHSENARYTFTPDGVPDFEDPDITQRRLLEQKAEGLIDNAGILVELGKAETREQAEEMLAEIPSRRPSVPPAQQSRFGELVLAATNGGENDAQG